ncbi:MAG: hypothetical protein IPH03_03755 [Tetrasphaera sp.]|nr:hypothetical protein [Tetrasphaera sp.]
MSARLSSVRAPVSPVDRTHDLHGPAAQHRGELQSVATEQHGIHISRIGVVHHPSHLGDAASGPGLHDVPQEIDPPEAPQAC